MLKLLHFSEMDGFIFKEQPQNDTKFFSLRNSTTFLLTAVARGVADMCRLLHQ